MTYLLVGIKSVFQVHDCMSLATISNLFHVNDLAYSNMYATRNIHFHRKEIDISHNRMAVAGAALRIHGRVVRSKASVTTFSRDRVDGDLPIDSQRLMEQLQK
jgi:hypothetical protein